VLPPEQTPMYISRLQRRFAAYSMLTAWPDATAGCRSGQISRPAFGQAIAVLRSQCDRRTSTNAPGVFSSTRRMLPISRVRVCRNASRCASLRLDVAWANRFVSSAPVVVAGATVAGPVAVSNNASRMIWSANRALAVQLQTPQVLLWRRKQPPTEWRAGRHRKGDGPSDSAETAENSSRVLAKVHVYPPLREQSPRWRRPAIQQQCCLSFA
jgi:hypothetical protein